MHVALIQKDPLPDPLVMSVGAALGAAGHVAEVFVPGAEPDLARALRGFAPGVLVFTPHCGFDAWCRRTATRLGTLTGGSPAVFVGPHAGHHPDQVLQDGVDIVLRGDPEVGLPSLVDAVAAGHELAEVPGVVLASPGGKRVEGPEPRPVRDIAGLPVPELQVYRRYPWVQQLGVLRFAVGRGGLENLHVDSAITPQELAGRFGPARRLPVEEALQRIHLHRNQWPLRRIAFVDETLLAPGAPAGWLDELLDRIRREVGLPFSCHARPDLLEGGRPALLARAGCRLVKLEVTCGDEELRRRVVGASASDDRIRELVRELRGLGIAVQTVSFVGLPGESVEQGLTTLDLLIGLAPCHAFALPYRDGDALPEAGLTRLRRILPLVVQQPRLRTLVDGALQRPMDGVWASLHQVHYDLSSIGFGDLSPAEVIRIALKMRAGRGDTGP